MADKDQSMEKRKRRDGTALRSVRLPNDVWNAAKDKAHGEGRTVSDVIRECLAKYIGMKPDDVRAMHGRERSD